jgi:hypothetical protein
VFGLAYFAFLYADIRRYLTHVKSRNPVLLNKDGEKLSYMFILRLDDIRLDITKGSLFNTQSVSANTFIFKRHNDGKRITSLNGANMKHNLDAYYQEWPIPVSARSKASVCGRSLSEIVDSKPASGMDLSLVSVVCCQVEVSATG